MLHRARSRDYARTGPTNFTKEQMSEYLADLRTKPPAKPLGSRPPPSSQSPTRRSMHSHEPSLTRSSFSSVSSKDLGHSRSSNVLSHRHGAESVNSGRSSPEKMYFNTLRDPEHRRAEKEETHAVRVAMDALHTRDHHAIDEAARQEATEIVRRHKAPSVPYRPPEHVPLMPVDPSDLVERELDGSNALHCTNPVDENARHRSPSRKLSGKFSFNRLSARRGSVSGIHAIGDPIHQFPNEVEKIWQDDDSEVNQVVPEPSPRKTSLTQRSRRNPFARAQSTRQNVGPVTDCADTKPRLDKIEIYRNPPTQSRDPTYTSNSSLAKKESSLQLQSPDEHVGNEEGGVHYRNGIEVRGKDIRAATSRSLRDRSKNLPSPAFVSGEPGRPIVSFHGDWRPPKKDDAGTSNVRPFGGRPSPKSNCWPNATMSSSDKAASAPVVPTLRDMDEASLTSHTRAPSMTGSVPAIAVDDGSVTPHVPGIHVNDVPAISVHDESTSKASIAGILTPSIQKPDDPESLLITPTPKPRPNKPHASVAARPQPRHSATAPATAPPSQTTPHAVRVGSTLCAQCALPIYGRTVAAAGTRFHPECFICCHCGEGLECVQFYPEPEESREARLDRMDRRLAGEDVDPPEGCSIEEDNDDSLRFYCHLDYHEFFSPKCKNCKTPIEGEMIVALGSQYHPGHFFCANCGDVSGIPTEQQISS